MDDFDAPQFYDFTRLSDSENDSDSFFDIEHTDETLKIGHLNGDGLQMPERNSLRRSMSFGDLDFLRAALENNDIERAMPIQDLIEDTSDNSPLNSTAPENDENNCIHDKPHPRKKTISEESIDRLSKPRYHLSDNNIHHRRNYVTMAEAVQKFHTKTPDRYHVRPSNARRAMILPQNGSSKRINTRPLSPLFHTENRQRTMVKQLTREEKELQEFQEHQKFKIKAKPVNKKILQGPIKPVSPVGNPSVEVSKPCPITSKTTNLRVADSSKKTNTEFRAQPVPKAVLQPPKSKFPLLRLPKPQTAAIPKPMTSQHETAKTQSKPARLQLTKPLPFSFELRDRMLQAKKDTFVRRILDDEKKAREFHARPIPKAVLEPVTNPTVILPKNRPIKTAIKETNNDLPQPIKFKARPATVVHKKPFVPTKSQTTTTPPVCPFKLSSLNRAAKREAFEKYLQEKEAEKARQKQQEEERLRALEAEEVKKLRKLTEHKAQPVRKYKEVHIVPSCKVTEPITPNFCTTRLRKRRDNKENIID